MVGLGLLTLAARYCLEASVTGGIAAFHGDLTWIDM